MNRGLSAIALVFGLTTPSAAQSPAPPGPLLKGLGTVMVQVVEPFVIGGEMAELSETSLQSLAEDTLKKNEVPVLDIGRDRLDPGRPILGHLVLTVTVVNGPSGPRGYFVNLRLMESATLLRGEKRSTMAATWDVGRSGPADRTDLAQRIHEAVGRVCDSFSTEYAAANPKGK